MDKETEEFFDIVGKEWQPRPRVLTDCTIHDISLTWRLPDMSQQQVVWVGYITVPEMPENVDVQWEPIEIQTGEED
jgi:hypothetical protein